MMVPMKVGERIQHLLLPQTRQKQSPAPAISQRQQHARPRNLPRRPRPLSAAQHQGFAAVEGECVCARTNAQILAGHRQKDLLRTARRAGNNHFSWEHRLHKSRRDGGSHLILFQGKVCPCRFPSDSPSVAASHPPWHLQRRCGGEEVRLSLPARPPRGLGEERLFPHIPGGMKRPWCLAWVQVLLQARARSLGLLSPRAWIPSSLAPQGMPACSTPTLAARLESPSVSLRSGSAGEMYREDGFPLQCSDTGRFLWAGKVGTGGSFPGPPAALPNPCPPCTVISLAELCRELAQSLATPASCKVSPRCPCSVPVLQNWGLQNSVPLIDPGALPAPGRHGWKHLLPPLLRAWVSVPLRSERWRKERGGSTAQDMHGRLCLHCPAAARGQAGCPFSPERQPASPWPLPAGVQAALLCQQLAPLCWVGTSSLKPKGSRGFYRDCSTTAQAAPLHFRIREVCTRKGIASFH